MTRATCSTSHPSRAMTVTPATRISTSARVLGVEGKVTATNAGVASLTFADASRLFQYDNRCAETPIFRANPAVLSAVRRSSSR